MDECLESDVRRGALNFRRTGGNNDRILHSWILEPLKSTPYMIARLIADTLYKSLHPVYIDGAENIPENGGAVIAANHLSLWDIVVLGISINRPMKFIAKHELWSLPHSYLPVSAAFMEGMRAIKLDRQGFPRIAYRKAQHALRSGHLIAVFPEGTRAERGVTTLQEFKPLATMLALKEGVPILPVGIMGTTDYAYGSPTIVNIGEAYYPSGNRNEASVELAEIVSGLCGLPTAL